MTPEGVSSRCSPILHHVLFGFEVHDALDGRIPPGGLWLNEAAFRIEQLRQKAALAEEIREFYRLFPYLKKKRILEWLARYDALSAPTVEETR